MNDGVRVLVFASQKGGSGKTTLSGHIAVEAERTGDGPVTLIDTDPQGSLAKWWNCRQASTPAFAHTALEELDACLDHLKSLGFKTIVVDTPPAVTQTIAHVVARADLVVVPTRPQPARPARRRPHGRHGGKPEEATGLRGELGHGPRPHHVGNRGRPVAARHGRADGDAAPPRRLRRVHD